MTCWFFHAWTKWKSICYGPFRVKNPAGDVVDSGQYVEQRRECSRCGKVDLREVRTRLFQ